MIPLPTSPPAAAPGVKASLQMVLIAGMNKIKIQSQNDHTAQDIKSCHKRNQFSHTFAMERIPPKITSAVKAATTIPTSAGAICRFPHRQWQWHLPVWRSDSKRSEACQKRKNHSQPLHVQSAFQSIHGSPLHSSVLCLHTIFHCDQRFTVFGCYPKTPVIQHQKTAPGPPRATAVPTPIIFPVPMVDASAVVRAPN